MKWFTLPLLLAVALFSAVAVVPFLPAAKDTSAIFSFEVTASTSRAGIVQLYFDSGSGYSEAGSSRAWLPQTAKAVVIRLALPPGQYRALRLDPLDREGTVIINRVRVVSSSGRVVREFPLSALRAGKQIALAHISGGQLEIQTTPGADDPQTDVIFDEPVIVHSTWVDRLARFVPYSAGVFVGLLVAVGLFGYNHGIRSRVAVCASWFGARPGRAIAAVAAVAVIASAYPVVFLGASYVSPNLGTVLLYDTYPTLPGYADGQTVDVKGSDIGAIMWQHVPFSMIQRRALAAGELPLWNRYSAGGVPLLGQGQSMFGDPLHFLVIAANGAAWAWDAKYLVAKWLFAVALGLLVLAVTTGEARQTGSDGAPNLRTVNLCAALLVTLAAPFIGFFVYRINHPAFFSVCYAPWALYCWIRVTQAPTRRAMALWATGLIVANFALMNSGTAKEAYILLLSLNFSGLFVLLASRMPWRLRLTKLVALSWAGIIFALLTAPVWLTFLHELKSSYTSYNAVSAYQIQPSLLLGAFDEVFYRPLMAEQRTFDPSVNFLILLGLLYFLATLRSSFGSRLVMALALSALVPIAFAFGVVSPRWVEHWPFLANVAHLDNSFTCVLIVLWTVLAGVGFVQAALRLGKPDGRGDLAIVALLLLGVIAAWIGFGQAVHRAVFGAGTTFTGLVQGQSLPVTHFIWGYLAALIIASATLFWAVRRMLVRGWASPALIIVATMCATVLLWRQGLHAQSVGFETYVVRPTLRVTFHAHSPAMDFVRADSTAEPARGIGLHNNFFPGWTGVYGLETTHGPDALANPYWRELTGNLPGVERIWDWRLYLDPPEAAKARPYLDALNVRYYFDLRSDQGLLGKSFRLMKAADLDVYSSPTAWPRAFFTDRVVSYDQAPDFVHLIGANDGRPFAGVQRSDENAQEAIALLRHDLFGRTVVAATKYRLTENTTSFDVHAPTPGVVVLNEAYWPGDFRAEANGQKLPILRMNHAMRGVRIDAPGDYHIVFRCVPAGFPRNMMLCGLGFALLIGSLGLALRQKPNAPLAA
jgi:hypothetical protein